MKVDSIITHDGYWTLSGPDHNLRTHVERALEDNNLNDYIPTWDDQSDHPDAYMYDEDYACR